MIILRYLLFPFSILYGLITSVRNFLFDKGILKSYSFDIPIIAVGNLSVGGTGKTPQIEYLIRLLSDHYKTAILSRGYKRKSKGFILADKNATADILGDEPFQMYQKFPDTIVAVDADRRNGITKILALPIKPDVILLDDAFQHRKVKADFYILLSAYNDLYFNDYVLPTGNLRESRNGAKRADVIVITKCPKDLSVEKQESIIKKIGLKVPVYFSFIDYDEFVYNENEKINVNQIKQLDKLLLAGIAKPTPFFDYIQNRNDDKLIYPDHHNFTKNDISQIKTKSADKIIVTTEKDYVRLKDENLNNLYYLPIKTSLISNKESFDDFVIKQVLK